MSLQSSIKKKFPSALGAYHFLWAWVGAHFHDHPSREIFVIGVTGTKGKTTTIEVLNAILEAAGKKTAILSSLREKIGDESKKGSSGNSMLGHAAIQKFLRRARAARCRYAIVEVTSQGVVQHRHRFINWNMGVITNLHPEHIESHGSFENYREAKLSFLQYVLKKGGKIFLNRNDNNFSFFADALAHGEENIMHYTRDDERLQEHFARAARMNRNLESSQPTANERFLASEFNRENVAVAVAIAKEIGISEQAIELAIGHFTGVPGRMEFVTEGWYTGIVDYAHTPDSLEAAYRAARADLVPASADAPAARLICVLGAAGGGRDRWKRPEFGKIAAHYCDDIILTNEDPYDENPESIIEEINSGIVQVPHPRPDVTTILDRHEALVRAVGMMDEGDIVIATGKGSEDWIHVANGKKIPWNEKAIIEALLIAKKNQIKKPALGVPARG